MIGWILGLGSFVLFAIALFYFLLSLLVIIPTWRIFNRAGFSGALALFHLVPVVGQLVVMAILAFSTWPNGEASGEARRRG